MPIKKVIDEDLDFPDEISIFHVLPEDEKPDHELHEKCWCIPNLQYKNPESGNEVWIHNYVQ